MIDMFDTLGDILNDAIGSHENNNVGHVTKQIYGYAEGGAVNDLADVSDDNVSLDNPASIVRSLGKAAGPVYGSSKTDDNIALGGHQSAYNTPSFLAKHFTDLGKFFNGAEPGNRYNKNPEQTKPLTSEDPNTFYARFYNQNRHFAQAEEIANRGQVTTRRT